jgi:hypothetical protein
MQTYPHLLCLLAPKYTVSTINNKLKQINLSTKTHTDAFIYGLFYIQI